MIHKHKTINFISKKFKESSTIESDVLTYILNILYNFFTTDFMLK